MIYSNNDYVMYPFYVCHNKHFFVFPLKHDVISLRDTVLKNVGSPPGNELNPPPDDPDDIVRKKLAVVRG